MAGVGIFVVVLAGVAIVTGSSIFAAGCLLGKCQDEHAGYVYGGLLSAGILSSIGVPLIVIGSRKEPDPPKNSATVSPWVARWSAGLSLRIDL
jgi:hypothetical protein